MSDKNYQHNGKGGAGVGGIPSTIPQAVGDAWISEYEAALKAEKKREIAHPKDGTFVPVYLEGMQGYILRCALANKNFKLISAPKPKEPVEAKE